MTISTHMRLVTAELVILTEQWLFGCHIEEKQLQNSYASPRKGGADPDTQEEMLT